MENLFTVCFDSDDDSFVLEEFDNLEDAIKFWKEWRSCLWWIKNRLTQKLEIKSQAF